MSAEVIVGYIREYYSSFTHGMKHAKNWEISGITIIKENNSFYNQHLAYIWNPTDYSTLILKDVPVSFKTQISIYA